MTTAAPRRLKGHTATTTCCIASRDRPGTVATAGEDGRVCWFDMRCEQVQTVMEIGEQPISCLCFKPGNEDIVYISSGSVVNGFDMRMASPLKPLKSYKYNREEVNQIACNFKGDFLASADDSGDVKIIDIRQDCPYKTLRAGHSSICSSVQFVPWRPWEVITGGLDSKMVIWDFSRGRPVKIVDFGSPDTPNAHSAAQCLNPAFVHAIAVPDSDMIDKSGKICAVARGDGVVNVISIENELAASRSKGSSKSRKGSHSISNDREAVADVSDPSQVAGGRLRLDYELGGHGASVSCVAFSLFGEKGKFLISGGNDKLVKVWDYTRYSDSGLTGDNEGVLHASISLSKKVNWLCTTPNESENLVVCDTTKVVKVYSVM